MMRQPKAVCVQKERFRSWRRAGIRRIREGDGRTKLTFCWEMYLGFWTRSHWAVGENNGRERTWKHPVVEGWGHRYYSRCSEDRLVDHVEL